MRNPPAGATGLQLARVPQDDTARRIQAQVGGRWVCWYGHATGHYWAMPRAIDGWYGAVEATTPDRLAALIARFETDSGRGGRP